MRIITKLAAALAVAIPLMAATGTAQARDTSSWSITIGSGYHNSGYGYGSSYGYGHRQRVLPPKVVRRYIQQSYREVSRLDRRGDVYVARAEDRRGRDVRVTADAYTGRIIDVQYTRRDNHRHWR